MADFTEKTFSDYYTSFKNLNDFVEENNYGCLPIPEHIEVCHVLRGDNDSIEYNIVVVELDNDNGTKGTWIGVNENLYEKIKPLESYYLSFSECEKYAGFWNWDVLLRQDNSSSCGCFGVAIDIRSIKNSQGNRNIPKFGDNWQWKTPTGSGIAPNLEDYWFYEATDFPCENCVIPIALNPYKYKGVEERKIGAGFIEGIYYAHTIVSNPWVSCVANLKRFVYNTKDPSTHGWIINQLNMNQENNCISRQYIAWNPDDIGSENFTFKASVVFYKDKFRSTTYPSIVDQNYAVDIVELTRLICTQDCRGTYGGDAPYLTRAEIDSGNVTEELVMSRWKNIEPSISDVEGTSEIEAFVWPYFLVMASNYDLCVTNFFELCILFLKKAKDKFSECF